MIIETIRLNEMCVFPEFLLGVSIMYLTLFSLLVSCNGKYGFPLMQSALINLSVMVLLMCCALLWNDDLLNVRTTSFCNSVVSDYLSFFSKFVIGISSAVSLLFMKDYVVAQKVNQFEYVIIIMLSILGLFLLCSANDLLTVYLGMELQSLSFYMLAAFKKRSSHSVDAGLKYFILRSLSSSLYLFGSSYLYVAFGTINFDDLRALSPIMLFGVGETAGDPSFGYFASSGLLFVFFSLFFKLSLAPFHLWSPDVYENSPSSSSFFFAVVPKIAIFTVLVRLSYYSLHQSFDWLKEVLALIAILSVMGGSLGGLYQRQIKSLLAYSSVSHMGYLMMAFSSGSKEGFQMVFCYLVVYMMSGLCIWSVFMLTRLKEADRVKQNKDLTDYVLLSKSNYMLALFFMVALFSVAGIPPMVGFIAKMNVFLVAIEGKLYMVALVGVLFSVISTFFYLRLIKIMYFEPVLVGRLYHSVDSAKVFIVVLLVFAYLFLFANPTFLYLMAYKIEGLFFGQNMPTVPSSREAILSDADKLDYRNNYLAIMEFLIICIV